MKLLIIVLSALISFSATAKPVRTAKVICDFSNFIDQEGKTNKSAWTRLTFDINLDTKKVKLSCKEQETCPLDGSTVDLKIVSKHRASESFLPIVGTGRLTTYSSNLSPINIEGSNGDDMDLFFRVSFEASSATELSATAVAITADEGVNGIVSAPTTCTVQ